MDRDTPVSSGCFPELNKDTHVSFPTSDPRNLGRKIHLGK